MEQSIGRYQVLQEIASGAQGTVYRAFDPEGGRIIALKVLHPTLSGDRTYTERFRREASLAASIDHPNVVEIFEVGTDGDRHFMALEFLPESLSGIIQSVGQLRIEGAARYAVQIADGLAAAHALGIVHRDVKPQNVLIGADGLAKVTDFGIARAESLATMTATGVVMGTPHYMSPEQSRGERADARSDVYSLGCIVYQMLAGELPFKGDTPLAVIRQQIDEDPPRLRGIRRDLPGRLESVVERAMEKDPRRRYQGTAEMAEALRAAVPGLAGPARAARHRPAPVPAPQPQPRPAPAPSPTPQAPRGPSTTFMRAWATAWRRSNRRRWAWLGTLLSVSVALTVAGVRLDGYDYVREFIGLADLSATVEEPAEGPAQIRPAEAPAPPAELAAVGKSDTNGASAVGGDATTEPKLPSAALPPATTPSAPSVPPAPTQAVIEKQVPEEVLVEQEMVETVEVPVEVEVAKEVVKPVEVPREVEAAEEVAVEPIEEPATQPTSPVSATTGPLPEDAVAFRGNSYLFVGEGMSWEEANRYAESLGGHLVTLSDEEEEAFVFELARSHGEGEFMLGLTDQANEGRFVWVTGEPMRYTNWGPSEPNNAGVTGEDFVQFEISAHGPWNDVPEFYSRFVVEFEDTPPADGLIAHWPAEGNANDIAGGNHGTLQGGATFAPGIVGQAFSFDGVDSLVEVPAAADLYQEGSTSITVQAWIKIEEPCHGIISGRPVWVLHWESCDGSLPERLRFFVGDNKVVGQQWEGVTSKTAADGEWHHWAGVYDGARLSIYLDGVLNNSIATTGPISNTGDGHPDWLTIGKDYHPDWSEGRYNKGLIDEIKIYDRALSADEIRAAYDAVDPAPTPAPPGSFALQFDGADDFVSIADNGVFDFNNAFSVEAWVKPLSINGGGPYKAIVRGAFGEPGGRMGGGWVMFQGSSDYSNWGLSVCVSACDAAPSGPGGLQVGQWQHLAATYDGANIEIYRDGIPIASVPHSGNVSDVHFVLLGIWETSFPGLIDEVRIWNVARSQAEIQSTMSTILAGDEPGLVGYWPFDEGAGQLVSDRSASGNHGRLGSSSGTDSSDPRWVASDEILPAVAAPPPAQPEALALPAPIAVLGTVEDYTGSSGDRFTRYRVPITNWESFPAELFEPAPELQPCGRNTNSSRAWVNVHNAETDGRIYGFCAFRSPDDLKSVWFAVPEGTPPPPVYVVLVDRLTDTTYRSNRVDIPAPSTGSGTTLAGESPPEREEELIATADQSAFTVGQRVQVNGQDVQVGGGYSSPVVVDWNNDGKKDLLVGDGQGYVSLLLNTGTDSNPLFPTEASVQAGGTALQVGQGGRDGASPFVVDWNNDGKKDLVVGDARGYVSLFLNTGTDSEPAFEAGTRVEANGNAIHLAERKPETTTGPEHGLADPFVIDWNNDGKKDLLVGNWPGYVYVFTNVGSDSAPVFAGGERIQANGTDIDFESLSPWVVDWNGDGQKDLLIGRHYGQLSGYLNAGSDSEPVFTERFDVRISTGSFISWDSDVAVADWNNDGNLDLVVGGRHGYLDLYVGNLLASGPPAVSIDSPERNSKTDSYVVTLSGAIRDSSIDHTRATVTVNGITHTAIVVQGAFTNQVVLTPGDNTIRVAATNSEGVGYDEVHINADIPAYPSFAEGFRVQAFHTDLKVEGIGASPTVVDWNGDGLKDLLVGTYNPGQISLYRNTGTQIGANNFARSEPIASGQDPIVVDWNNDGSMDLVTGGGGVRVYLNRGDDSSPVLDDPIRLGLNGRHPFVVDWDNDGRKDLLIGRDGSSGEAYINLYLNTGTDDAPAFAESSTIRANEFGIRESYGSAPYVLDWNGDGSKDLLVRESRGFYSFLNVGTDSSPLFANKIPVIADGLPLQLYSGDGTTNFSVADWNDDGVRDLVLGDYDGFIYVYLGK